MKKTIILFILILSVFYLTGCTKKNNKETEETPKTVATVLAKNFETELEKEKDIKKIAEKISQNDIIIPQMQVFEIGKEDYLSGFKEEIKGFKKAYGIAPMISTIPFIAYVFEVEEPEEFKKTLETNAQLDWNICTKADEMKISSKDNYIFFVMSPKTFEE